MKTDSEQEDKLLGRFDGALTYGPESDTEILREAVLRQVEALNLPSWANLGGTSKLSKAGIRDMHKLQRQDTLRREMASIGGRVEELIQHFADGSEVCPEAIDPEIVPVRAVGYLLTFSV